MLGFALFVLSITLRAVAISKIMPMTIPTAIYGTFLALILVCLYKDEISLYNAEAEVFSVIESP